MMKIFLACFILIISAVFSSAEDTLSGIWVSSQPSQNGLTHILEYKNSGVVISSIWVMMTGSFSVEGERVTLRYDGTNDLCELVINFADDHLQSIDKSVSLERLSPKNGSVVGNWVGKDQNSQVSYVFRENGHFVYQKPMPGYTASKYVIRGNQVDTYRDGTKQGTSRWEITGGNLILTENDRKYSYVRGSSN
jgi:hypothetical protein